VNTLSKSALDARARWRAHTIDNLGGFQLLNERNCIVGGARFDLTAENVIEYCRSR
jgi:hypothetical protein